MIFNKEISGAWEHEPSETLVLHKVDPSSLQIITQQVAEKVAMLVESNERMLDPLVNVYGKSLVIAMSESRIPKSAIPTLSFIFSYLLNTIIGVWQALKMISESRGEVTETRETEERVLDTREGLRDPMFPTKLMVGAEGEEEAEVEEERLVVEVGAIKTEVEANDLINPGSLTRAGVRAEVATILQGGLDGVPIPRPMHRLIALAVYFHVICSFFSLNLKYRTRIFNESLTILSTAKPACFTITSHPF